MNDAIRDHRLKICIDANGDNFEYGFIETFLFMRLLFDSVTTYYYNKMINN